MARIVLPKNDFVNVEMPYCRFSSTFRSFFDSNIRLLESVSKPCRLFWCGIGGVGYAF
jgi:hypothetical protein